jgi:hypothetical protein
MNSSGLVFLTSPHLDPQTIDGQSVVPGDKPKALALYDAVAHDTVAQWLATASPSPAPN